MGPRDIPVRGRLRRSEAVTHVGFAVTAVIPGFARSRVDRLPWRYHAEVLTHLARTGWEVRVVTDSASAVDGWITAHVASALPVSPWGARRVAHVINQGRPGVVLAPMGVTSLAHGRLLGALRTPLVGLVLQHPYRLPQIPWSRMVNGETLEQAWLAGLGGLVPDPVKAWGLRWGARFIVSSRATEERLRGLGIPSEATLYAPPGLDPSAYKRPAGNPAPDNPRILYFGSCLRLRGIDRVLEAFQLLRRHHPDLELVILDRGDGGFDVAGELQRKGIADDVTLVRGALADDDIRSWIAGATVALLPFRMALQDSPLTILEAQALGTPVVSCNVPGVAEFVEPPGVVVPSPDPSSVAKAVEDILALHPLPASFRNALARRTRNQTPTWEETCASVQTLLEELVQP